MPVKPQHLIVLASPIVTGDLDDFDYLYCTIDHVVKHEDRQLLFCDVLFGNLVDGVFQTGRASPTLSLTVHGEPKFSAVTEKKS